MSLLRNYLGQSITDCLDYQKGQEAIKAASEPSNTYALKGRLYASSSGWLLLAVPNALVRGIFDTMHELGITLPPGSGGKPFNAHISVARPEELEAIGGVDKISERGKHFSYQLGPIKTVTPMGWDGMSKVWFVHIESPELKALRKSYGLSPLPKKGDKELQFHLTVAVRRKSVLLDNEVSKAASDEELQDLEQNLNDFAADVQIVADFADKVTSSLHSHECRVKLASLVPQLRRAKAESDRRNYRAKHKILRQLMQQNPEQWIIDQPDPLVPGITHAPTGFRYHLPFNVIPDNVKLASPAHEAITGTPLNYNPTSGVFKNVLDHMQSVQDTANRIARGNEQYQDTLSGMNKEYGMQRFVRALGGEYNKPSFQERFLRGFPFANLGKFFT